MDYLYSPYDALLSISPSGNAWAVVDAMERNMGTTPATQQDILLLKQEIALLRQELFAIRMERKFAGVERRLTFRLGAIFFTGCALLIASERLWV